MQLSSRLIFSFLFTWVLILSFIAGSLIGSHNIISLISVLLIIFPILFFLFINNINAFFILFLFVFFGLPEISSPLKNLVFYENILSPFIMDSDRFKPSLILSTIFGIIFLLRNSLIIISKKNLLFFSTSIFFFAFLLFIILSKNLEGYSQFQIYIDLLYILNIWNIFVFLYYSRNDFSHLAKLFLLLFKYFALIIVLDISITYFLGQFFPWSISYRGGLQGFFFAHELPYSIALVFTYIYFFTRKVNLLVKFLFTVVFMYLIFLTNIKTSAFTVVVIFILHIIPNLFKTSKYVIVTFLLFISLFVYFNLIEIFSSFETIASRIGTLIVYCTHLFSDLNNLIFGIFPGSTSYEMRSNLALYFYKNVNFTQYFTPEMYYTISDELITRYKYNHVSGAFLPHNSFIILLSSYGISFLIFTIIFFKYLFEIISNYKFIDKNYIFFYYMMISIYTISFFHPVMLFAELVLFKYLLLDNIRENKQIFKKNIVNIKNG